MESILSTLCESYIVHLGLRLICSWALLFELKSGEVLGGRESKRKIPKFFIKSFLGKFEGRLACLL